MIAFRHRQVIINYISTQTSAPPVNECERYKGVVIDVGVAQRRRDVRRDRCLDASSLQSGW